jgi:hypothetical protein
MTAGKNAVSAVREEMMDMMRAGEAPKDMKDRLDKVGQHHKST